MTKPTFVFGLSLASLMAPALAHAQATGDTHFRFDNRGRSAGVIGPDPDGGGVLRRPAMRRTYNTRGNLTKIEIGDIATVEAASVDPSNWVGFTRHIRYQIAYDSLDRPTEWRTFGSDNKLYSVVQYSYNHQDKVECAVTRMNPAAFGGLPSNACDLGPEGNQGPDRITKNIYDAAGQLRQVREGVGTASETATQSYDYDANSRVKVLKDGRSNRTEFAFDGLGRLEYTYFPAPTAGQTNYNDYEKYTYDAKGNRTSLRKRDGSVIRFTFDNLDRVTKKDVPYRADLPWKYRRDVYYGYDLAGHQTYARFDSATGDGVTKTYDAFGRLELSTVIMDGQTRALASAYDVNGNRTRLTHPDGIHFDYVYDGLDRPKTLRQNGSWLSGFAYDERGQASVFNRGNSSGKTTWSRDPVGRLSTLQHSPPEPTAAVTLGYDYNPAFQITGITRSNDNYVYSGPISSQTLNYTRNHLNQYTSVSNNAYSYDANGNLLSDGGWTYKYDFENRLVEASNSGVAVRLKYDPLGRLYESVGTGEGLVRYLHDGDALVGEYASNGSMLRRYIHGTEDGTDDPLIWYEGASITFSARRHLLTNHQGTVIGITDAWGKALSYNRFDEWGEPQAGSMGRFQYTGQAWLPDLGMYHYKARIYSPRLGRFLQTDPVGYQDQANLYAYVRNDPINKTDPSGELWVQAGLFVLGAGGDVAMQLLVEGKSVGEVDLVSAGVSGMQTAVGLGALGNLAKLGKTAYRAQRASAVNSTVAQQSARNQMLPPSVRLRPRIREEYGLQREAQRAVTAFQRQAAVTGGAIGGSQAVKEVLPEFTVSDAATAAGIADNPNVIVVVGKRPKKGFWQSLRRCFGMCDGIID